MSNNKGMVRATAIASGVVVLALTAGLAGFAIARTGEGVQVQKAHTTQVAKKALTKTLTDSEWVEMLRLEAEEEARDAAEDKAEADWKAKNNAPDAAEEALDAKESEAEAAAAQKAYEDALAAQQNGQPVQPTQPAQTESAQPAQVPDGGTVYGDDVYKQEGGVVYEYDDGAWEPEADKKIENNTVYEYDDGVWEADYDTPDYDDYDDDWDDDRDDWDDDDDDD